MMSKITKAIVLTAGFGTRFLPATKSYPKALLTIIDKPVTHYLADEICSSGIKNIFFIVGEGAITVKNYFTSDKRLESYLEKRGKLHLAEELKTIQASARFSYALQKEANGTGGALLKAERHIGQSPFALVYADDVIDASDPCLLQLMRVHEERNAPVLALERVPKKDVSRYGVIQGKRIGARTYIIERVIEKPDVKDAPSNLVSIGRFILTPEIVHELHNVHLSDNHEICLTEAFNSYIKNGGALYGYEFEGKRFDCGDKLGFMKATVHYGMKHPEIGQRFYKHLKSMHTKIRKPKAES